MAYEHEIRYASKAVYGSSAYAYEYEEPFEAAEPEVRVRPAEEKRVQTKYSVSIMSVLGFITAGILLVLSLCAYIRLTEISVETTRLEERFDELNEENRRLKIAYEEAFDKTEIKEYAVNVLGMQEPADEQVTYLNIANVDKAVKLQESTEENSTLYNVVTLVKSFFAYF